MTYNSLTKEQLSEELSVQQARYDAFKARGLKLDMSRGKPGADQLDLTNDMLYLSGSAIAADGMDCRNYGGIDGIKEAKELFAAMMEVKPSEIIVGGNSSLNMMYDAFARAMTHGVMQGDTPWCKLPKVKWLCPVPGYDRHFTICEHFGIEMINVPLLADGPDMDEVERLVSGDDSIKGIWCVPKYSNPTGNTYSDETVDRFARLNPAAKDFRIFWDNAYDVHHLTDEPDRLKNIVTACREAGNPDLVFMFSSTSKISFPGAGVALLASSEANINRAKKLMGAQTIGPDKLNQLRHVRFFCNVEGIHSHMKKHAAILKPKFDVVFDMLDRELSGLGVGEWSCPRGGYFVSFDTPDGCASRTVSLAKEAGVVLTPAGSTYPYLKDPRDRNIRIAPTFPPVSELKAAMELFCICVKLASLEKLLAQ